MQKYEVAEKLKRFEGLEKIAFVMGNKKQIVHVKHLENYPEAELLQSEYDNFMTLYCSIDAVYPIL